ncbi:mapk-regulated corepressor-interacting protein 1-like isoform X2 [Ruditapes philippinarum]|uniref:mapk-regulated corepressor-interacting protein 1-like isoform X2 n=1 Tax=Ruditapes philippinarum TaxID=129788 RepID=UPI00295B3588|nr:mapk-regulated corepressor-interacting protein 1-like isoform X2 [Ruditapes philippinarum]
MGRGMYALPSRPNKIVANARIGPSKTLNNLEISRDTEKQQLSHDTVGMSSPKPVFNGNRNRSYPNPMRQNSNPQQPQYTAQHEEFVRILSDSWNRVNHELERNQREGGPIVYREKNPNPMLNGFKPFDLEQFWGDRYMQQVTGSTS